MKKTKVVCTIGPASEDLPTLKSLIESGMNVMRMNFSHGDHAEQGARIEAVRKLNKENGWNVGIMLDTKGPEIRTGYLKNDEPVELVAGETVRLTMDYSYLGDEKKFAISYPGLYEDIHIGGKVLIEDGNITLTVLEKDEATKELVCRIENGRKLKNKKNVNVPGVKLNMKFIADKDEKDLVFGCEQNVDFVSASFVRRAQDVKDIQELFAKHGNTHTRIICKIENQEGVDNMEEIIALSDGVMVARGDLGVAVDPWLLPEIQKQMIYLAQSQGKIAVTATQMLDSMIQNPRPTRAEVTDCHNAVLDGTSATMLSGESAQGDYPQKAVWYMSKIDEEAEKTIDYGKMIENVNEFPVDRNQYDAVALAAVTVAYNYDAAAIVVDGPVELATAVSQYRPCVSCFCALDSADDCRTLSVYYALEAVNGDAAKALAVATEKLSLAAGDTVLKVTEDGVSFITVE